MKPSHSSMIKAFNAAVKQHGHPVFPMLNQFAHSGYCTFELSGYDLEGQCWKLTRKASRSDFLAFIDALNQHLPKGRKVKVDKLNDDFYARCTLYHAVLQRNP